MNSTGRGEPALPPDLQRSLLARIDMLVPP